MDVSSIANTLLIVSFGIAAVSFVAGTLLAPLAIYRATVLHRYRFIIAMVILYGVSAFSFGMVAISWLCLPTTNW